MGKYNGYKKKSDKSLSAKKLAQKAMRAVNKMEAEEETKWFDQSSGASAGVPLYCEPFTTTDQTNSVVPLTDLQPRQSVNTALGVGLPTINTSNYRDGARVYISGIYLKAQFYWDQIRNTATERYPPYANVSWAVVKQMKNNSAVDPYTPTILPTPKDVWQDPAAVGNPAPPLWNQSQAPLGSLLFKNMNNGHNYKVLRKGCFCLAAPVMVQQGPATVTPGPGLPASESSYGFRDPTTVPGNSTLPHQFSNNSVKTLNIKLHPKTRCRYRQLPEKVNDQTLVTNEEVIPLENGIYFMFWSDVGDANLDSRFYSQDLATYTIAQPRLIINTRIRFKDL